MRRESIKNRAPQSRNSIINSDLGLSSGKSPKTAHKEITSSVDASC